jgi:hypothetical protein
MKAIGLCLIEIALGGIAVSLTCFSVTSCSKFSLATGSDKEAIERLQRDWGSKYDFKLTLGTYWKTRLKPNVPLDEQELRAILEEFVEGRDARDSGFVYMNVYDANGRFLVQFYRDRDGTIQKSTAEYY